MFKPTLTVAFAKNKKPSKVTSPEPTKTALDYAEIAMDVFAKVGFGVACTIATYVVLDTARQVIVNQTNPSNHS